MYFDDVSQSVMRELARIHKRKMAPLKKALESAIVRAAKTDCWYDPWNRKGVRADYGVLYEPVNAFIKDADVEDILSMVDFLLEKERLESVIEALVEMVPVVEFSADAASRAGEIRSVLDKAGKTIGVMDALIAANALTEGCVLVTNNVSHFSRIPELTIENWATV